MNAQESYPTSAWLWPFVVASVSWGSSFLFIAVALNSFAPEHVGFGRVFVGAGVLAVMVLVRRERLRFTWRQVGSIALIGLCLSGAPMVLIPLAQEHITSILASLLNATTPLWTALCVALFIPHERATRAQWVGLLLGALGIAVLVGAWDVNAVPLAGTLFMLSATALYGVGSTLSRVLLRTVKQSNASIAFVQIGLSAVMLLPVALIAPAPEASAFDLGAAPGWALLALGVFGSSFAYVAFWRVIQVAGATAGASVTYAVPVVATILGIAVLGEHLKWYEPLGAAVVLTGVWLAQRKPRAKKVGAAPDAGAVA